MRSQKFNYTAMQRYPAENQASFNLFFVHPNFFDEHDSKILHVYPHCTTATMIITYNEAQKLDSRMCIECCDILNNVHEPCFVEDKIPDSNSKFYHHYNDASPKCNIKNCKLKEIPLTLAKEQEYKVCENCYDRWVKQRNDLYTAIIKLIFEQKIQQYYAAKEKTT